MDYLTICNKAAGEINELIQAGKRAEANDLLMFKAERIAKDTRNAYADTKQAIAFFLRS